MPGLERLCRLPARHGCWAVEGSTAEGVRHYTAKKSQMWDKQLQGQLPQLQLLP